MLEFAVAGEAMKIAGMEVTPRVRYSYVCILYNY